MSPQHFKALVGSLVETLKAYENAFGKLTIPEGDIKPKLNAAQIEVAINAAREAQKSAGVAKGATIFSSETTKP